MKIKKLISLYLVAIILTLILSAFIATVVRAQETVEVPQDVKAISEELGEQYNICPELIQAICWMESRFQPDAENGGCIGIMQISPKWHKDRMDRLGITDLTDTRQNMTVAVDYLLELFNEYEDAGAALMKYNGDSRLGNLIDGTGNLSEYAEEVLSLSAELERRNGK